MAEAGKRTVRASKPAEDLNGELLDLVGHELRTPITALKGHIQLLQRRLRRQPEREADLAELGKMLQQVERLNHELGVYLDAVHIGNGCFDLMPSECDLVAIARRGAEMLSSGADDRVIRVESDEAQLVGTWDRRRLEEVIMALLTNALKFSSDDNVDVHIVRDGARVSVEVSDRGIGVLSSERRQIFEAYTRGSNAGKPGLGLGLYVAREAVKSHGGQIGVRGRRGGGSTFWFAIPLVAPMPLAAVGVCEKASGPAMQATRNRSSKALSKLDTAPED